MVGFESITGFVIQAVSHPVSMGWVIVGLVFVCAILYSLKHLLDITLDLWKLPFAIGIDAIDLLAYDNGYFDIVAGIGAFVLFWIFAKRGHHLSKFFALIAIFEALVGIWFLPEYAFITNLFPLCTLLVFVSIWSH